MSKPWEEPTCDAREDVPALLDEVERLTVEVDRLGLSCPVAGHDAPVEPVPEGVVQQTVPIQCPHCARELRQAFDTLTENLEAAEDRERGWKIQTQIAESEVAEQAKEIERLRERCLRYNEATTILLECDHGDAECGCRDRAMERLMTLLPKQR